MTFRKILFLFLAVSLFFTSCEKSTDSLSNAIPADANYVLHFDNKALIEKSKYDIFKNPTVQQGINVSKAMLKDEAKIKIVDNFLKDANSFGLNLKNDLYFYTNYSVYGIVIGVDDASKLKDNIQKLSMMPEDMIKTDGDINYISPDSKEIVAWDKNKLIVVVDITSPYRNSDNTPVNVEELAKTQLKQSSDKSINTNKAFAEFSKSKKDISIFYSMKGMDKLYSLYGLNAHAEAMNSLNKLFENLEGLSVGMYTSFEKGEVKATSQTYFENADAEKKYKDLVNKMTGTLKGDQLKYIPKDPLFAMSTNVKGEGIYSYLKEIGLVDMMIKEIDDSMQSDKIAEIVQQFNGDVTLAVTSVKEEGYKTIPECALFAEVSDTEKIMAILKEELLDKNAGAFTEVSPTVFYMDEGKMKIYFGINNNNFFVTNIESVYNSLNSTDLKNEYSDIAKGKSSLMYGNIQTLKPLVESGGKSTAQALLILNELGKYEFVASVGNYTGEGKLEFATKDKNSLEVLCLKIDQIISALAPSFGM